jgi:hypothetical protein
MKIRRCATERKSESFLMVAGLWRFSFVSQFQDLWVRNNDIREARLKKLSDWIDQYYKWSNWDEAGKETAAGAS